MRIVTVAEQRLAGLCTAVALHPSDGTLALASDDELTIFGRKSGTHDYIDTQSLSREFHSQPISGLGWCGQLLATCSHDAGAVVWEAGTGASTWTPTLVVTRLQKAALCLAWAPRSHGAPRLAIGGVDGAVVLCHRDDARSLWAPRLLCQAREGGASGVTGLAWHPSGEYLATVSVDGCLAIYSTAPAGRWDWDGGAWL